MILIAAPKTDEWEKDTLHLNTTANVEKMQPIKGKFILKVVKKDNVRTFINKAGGTSNFLPLVVKDITGEKTQITLWPNHVKYEEIQENKTYFFENIGTGYFPPSKPHHLASRINFKLTEVPEMVSAKFDLISYFDKIVEGEIFGASSFHHYKSCLSCYKKIWDESSKKCYSKICGKEIEIPNIDFNCLMEIQTAIDQVVIKVFKRMLPVEIDETNQEEIGK